jgi:hypothetical protein
LKKLDSIGSRAYLREIDMVCPKCKTELRANARFCRNCGEPTEDRSGRRGRGAPRLTVALPREAPPTSGPDSQRSSNHAQKQEDVVILPLAEKPASAPPAQKTPEPEAEIVALPPASTDVPQLIETALVKRNIREKVPPPITALARRPAEAKPFITQVLGADPESQQKRLLAIVPLLLLVVILLFVFAFFYN